MEMKKCKCGKVMEYDHYYQCYECDCGKCYNAVGQELAPKDNWKDEYDEEDYDNDDYLDYY